MRILLLLLLPFAAQADLPTPVEALVGVWEFTDEKGAQTVTLAKDGTAKIEVKGHGVVVTGGWSVDRAEGGSAGGGYAFQLRLSGKSIAQGGAQPTAADKATMADYLKRHGSLFSTLYYVGSWDMKAKRFTAVVPVMDGGTFKAQKVVFERR